MNRRKVKEFGELPIIKQPDDMGLESRLSILEEYLQIYEKRGIVPTYHQLVACMRQSGWLDYNKSTVWHDKRRLNQGSNFVRDLAARSYSSYIEQCYETLDDVETKAYDMFDTNYKVKTRRVKKWTQDGEPRETVEESVADVPYQVKIEALKVIQKSVDLKTRIVSGENIQLSAAMLAEKFRKLHGENEQLRKMLGKNAVVEGDNADLR